MTQITSLGQVPQGLLGLGPTCRLQALSHTGGAGPGGDGPTTFTASSPSDRRGTGAYSPFGAAGFGRSTPSPDHSYSYQSLPPVCIGGVKIDMVVDNTKSGSPLPLKPVGCALLCGLLALQQLLLSLMRLSVISSAVGSYTRVLVCQGINTPGEQLVTTFNFRAANVPGLTAGPQSIALLGVAPFPGHDLDIVAGAKVNTYYRHSGFNCLDAIRDESILLFDSGLAPEADLAHTAAAAHECAYVCVDTTLLF